MAPNMGENSSQTLLGFSAQGLKPNENNNDDVLSEVGSTLSNRGFSTRAGRTPNMGASMSLKQKKGK